MKKIGDKFFTEEVGEVVVIDIYISITTTERIYKVKDEGDMESFFKGGQLLEL
jgi:hypothetical protein